MIHKIKLKNAKEVLLVDEKTYNYFTTDPYLIKIDFINRIRLHSSGCAVFQRHVKRKFITIYVHRHIAEKFKARERSKIKTLASTWNGNKLDCRIDNILWRSKALALRQKKSKSKSGYTGVHIEGNKYRAVIAMDKKLRHIGMYPTVEEAAMAYNKVSRIHFGDHGKINIIKAAKSI